MTVSVLIPNYNHAPFFKQRIDSVINQTFKDYEIIILDDCSTDNSREVLEVYRHFPKVSHMLFNEQNSGSTFKQWNKGIALAQGKYIWIAESDDFADPHLLEKLVAKLETDPEVGIAYCNSLDVDDKNNISLSDINFYAELDPVLWTRDFNRQGIDLVKKFMSYRNIIPNASAVVLRRQIVQEVGAADVNFRINGDWLYWASILAKTKVAYVAEPLNYFRRHTNNVRSTTILNGTNLVELSLVTEEIQKYGTPDTYFFDKMIRTIIRMWFDAIIEFDIPLKKHFTIYNTLNRSDKNFWYRFREEFNNYMLPNNFKGLRRLVKVGILYRLLKRNKN